MLANESARQRERLEKKEAGKEIDEDNESVRPQNAFGFLDFKLT